MSKMKEIDLIAQGVADHCKEIMYDTVEWQIADQPVFTNKIRLSLDNIYVTNKITNYVL